MVLGNEHRINRFAPDHAVAERGEHSGMTGEATRSQSRGASLTRLNLRILMLGWGGCAEAARGPATS